MVEFSQGNNEILVSFVSFVLANLEVLSEVLILPYLVNLRLTLREDG